MTFLQFLHLILHFCINLLTTWQHLQQFIVFIVFHDFSLPFNLFLSIYGAVVSAIKNANKKMLHLLDHSIIFKQTHFNNNIFIIYVTMNFYEWKLAAIKLLHTIAKFAAFMAIILKRLKMFGRKIRLLLPQ